MKRVLAAVAISLATTLCALSQAKELVAAFGGAYTDALRKTIATFETENDVKVTFVPASGADGLAKAMAKEVDVIHAEGLGLSRRGSRRLRKTRS